ncbi:MAG: hypothetical protein ACREON_15350 [Gemmatimonadaceae bacterium]
MVHPLVAYAGLRAVVRAVSAALANVALARVGLDVDSAALRRGAELGRALELRDEAGALVPTDFIEITEWPGGDPEVAAMIRFRATPATVPAALHPRPRGDADAESPAA